MFNILCIYFIAIVSINIVGPTCLVVWTVISDVQRHLVKADRKELDTSVFEPEMHFLRHWQLRIARSCDGNLSRDVSAVSRGETPRVNRGIGKVRQVRAEPVTVRVVVAGAEFRARDDRAPVADERVDSERVDQARDFPVPETKVQQARDVVYQDEDLAFRHVVADKAAQLV